MTWGEAWRLYLILAGDPSSQVAAAIQGWTHPVSREALVLFDLLDLQHTSKAKRRPSPYPRPWLANERKRRGRGMPVADLRAILDEARGTTP